MEEDTSNAGGEEAAVDTGNNEESVAEVTDETGGVTPEEISKALGPKYKTAAPVAESKETEDEAEEAAEDVVEEAETEEEVAPKEKPEVKPEVKADTETSRFAFEVKDANDVTYKIEPGDSIEDVLKDFEPKNNGQIIAILDQLREAKDNKAKFEADQAEELTKANTAQRVADIQTGWNEEIKALQADKRIPVTVKGTDNERVAEVYQFMAKENDARIKSNKPTIGSFEDALDKLENQEARTAKIEQDKTDKETARKNGALVGGSSAASTGSATPVYKSGSAKNPNQALKVMGIL